MGVVTTKLMIDAEESPLDDVQVTLPPHGFEIPEGFAPATKAQVAYWRQLCGAISERGSRGIGNTDWPRELAPTHISLRAMEERKLIVRRSRSWHLRRGWYTTLTLMRVTAVPTPPLVIAERPAPSLPTFAELETWEKVCRWLDQQRHQPVRLPILGVPGLPGVGDVSADMLRGMRSYRLVRHGSDCTWRLSPTWKHRLLTLWHGVTKAEANVSRSCWMCLLPTVWRQASTPGTSIALMKEDSRPPSELNSTTSKRWPRMKTTKWRPPGNMTAPRS